MTPPRLLGVYREAAHSPGRVGDDARVLERVAERLRSAGCEVVLVGPDALADAVCGSVPDLVFAMCEQASALEVLEGLAPKGVRFVNEVGAIRNTFRDRMLPRLAALGDAFPPSRLVPTAGSDDPAAGAAYDGLGPVWVKRGDFHQTRAGDVTFAADGDQVAHALLALARRDVENAVVQVHVPGDLVKFYGVGLGADDWFCHFHHAGQRLAGTPYEGARLAALARRAAGLLGLEVYGGDAIVRADGGLVVIDVNTWPSFALVREEAAERIAAHLLSRLREPAGAVAQEGDA